MTATKVKNKGGQPTKFKDEHVEQIEFYAAIGLTDEEMSYALNIDRKTLHNWKVNHAEFFLTLKKGKVNPNSKVAKKLYIRAIGYKYNETKKIFNAEGKMVRREVTTKMVLPDTTAQIFWLKNRRPDLWRDKHDVDVNMKEKLHEELDGLSNPALNRGLGAIEEILGKREGLPSTN